MLLSYFYRDKRIPVKAEVFNNKSSKLENLKNMEGQEMCICLLQLLIAIEVDHSMRNMTIEEIVNMCNKEL